MNFSRGRGIDDGSPGSLDPLHVCCEVKFSPLKKLRECLSQSAKCEEIDTDAYDGIGDARDPFGQYLNDYNSERGHQSLDRQTSDEVYFQQVARRVA